MSTIPLAEGARQLGVKPSSLRERLSRCGHIFGVKPLKAANGRLLLPANFIELITANPPPKREHGLDGRFTR